MRKHKSTKALPPADVELLVRDGVLGKWPDIFDWFCNECYKHKIHFRYSRHPESISAMLKVLSKPKSKRASTQLGVRASESAKVKNRQGPTVSPLVRRK